MPQVQLPAPGIAVSHHPALGCWQLEGVPDLGPVGVQPRVVLLDSADISRDPASSRFRLLLSEVDSSGFLPLSYWVPTQRDGVVLEMGTGVSVLQLRLRLREDSLIGRGYFATDALFEGVKSFEGVRGHRVTCLRGS